LDIRYDSTYANICPITILIYTRADYTVYLFFLYKYITQIIYYNITFNLFTTSRTQRFNFHSSIVSLIQSEILAVMAMIYHFSILYVDTSLYMAFLKYIRTFIICPHNARLRSTKSLQLLQIVIILLI